MVWQIRHQLCGQAALKDVADWELSCSVNWLWNHLIAFGFIEMILRVHHKLKIHYGRGTAFCTEGNLSSGPTSYNSEIFTLIFLQLFCQKWLGNCAFFWPWVQFGSTCFSFTTRISLFQLLICLVKWHVLFIFYAFIICFLKLETSVPSTSSWRDRMIQH